MRKTAGEHLEATLTHVDASTMFLPGHDGTHTERVPAIKAHLPLITKQGYTNIPQLLPLDVMYGLVVESLRSDPVTLIFWGLACVAAFFVPASIWD